MAFIRSRITPPAAPQNNNNDALAEQGVVDQTNQVKTLLSEISTLIYKDIKKNNKDKEFFITELQKEITDCINHLFKVIFEKLSKADTNLNINGVDILPEKRCVRLIENLLIMVQKHLGSLDEDSNEQTIKKAFRDLATELLETAFPGKQHDKSLPSLLQSILNGSWFYSWASGGATAGLSWDQLIEKFADFGAKLYTIKLNKKVDDAELENYNGVSQLAKDLAQAAVQETRKIKSLPFELKDLSEESGTFLNHIFVSLLRVPDISDEDVEDHPVNIVNQTWSWLENSLENAISGILCIIFKPENDQTVEERYQLFVESLAGRALEQIPQWHLWEQEIDSILNKEDPAAELHTILNQLEKLEKHNTNNQDPLIKDLAYDLSNNIKTLRNILKIEDFVEAAKKFLTERCYSYFARQLLQDELHTQELKGALNLPEFISADKLFTLLYDNIGNLLKEFYDHHQDISERNLHCEQKLAEWNIPGLGNLLKDALTNLTQVLEEKAGNQDKKLIEEYDFLNEIVCHLLKKPEENHANTEIAGVKQKALSFIENVIKIVIVEEIEKEIGDGTVEEALKKISGNLMAKASIAIESIDGKLDLEESDQQAFDELIAEIYNAIESKKQRPAFSELDLNESSQQLLADLFSIKHTLKNEEIDQAIKEKIISDALEFLKAHPDLSLEDFQNQLIIDWKIKKETKGIFSTILPEEDFNKLLPPTFKNKGLWNLVCEKLLSPYLHGIYEQKHILTSLENSNNQQKLDEPELEALVDQYLPIIKKKLLELRTEVPELDQMLNGLMGENGMLSGLFDKIVGPIFKSFLAYHVNGKDGKTSQELTADLFWEIINTAWKAFQASEQDHENAKNILKTAASDITDRLIPKDLWESRVSEQFRMILSREMITHLIFASLEKGHSDYLNLQALRDKSISNIDDKAAHLEIPTFLKKLVENILAVPKDNNQNDWVRETVGFLLNMNNDSENKPLNELIECLLFGISDTLIVHAMNNQSLSENAVLDNLEDKLGRVAKMAKPLLNWLNKEDGNHSSPPINEKYITEYREVTGEEVLTSEGYHELTYWFIAKKTLSILLPDETWNQLVPELVRGFLTKNTVAGFLVPILKDIHELRKNLQNSGEEIEKLIIQSDNETNDDLNQFIEDKLITSVREVLKEIGKDETDLDSLPPFVRTLLIKLLTTNNADIKDFRDRLIKQIVYVAIGQLMDQDNLNSSEKIMELIHTCIQEFQGKKTDLEIATLLFDNVIPVDYWYKMIPEMMGNFITRESVIKAIVPYVTEVRKKINLFENKNKEAVSFFDSIDPKHGIRVLLAQAFHSLDEMIDEYAKKEEKIAPNQPLLVNDLIKKAFGDEPTAPMIKDGIHSLILIALHEALKENKENPNETFQERILALVGKLTAVFKSGQTSMPQLLKVFIPDNLRKELLPLFLHKSFTYEKMVQWFFEEDSQEIEDIKTNLDDYNDFQLDNNFVRLSHWIKDQLASQKMFKDIIFDGDEMNEDIDGFIDVIFNEMSKENHIKELLGANFLSYASNAILTNVNDVELPEGDFNKLAGEKFLSALHLEGSVNLPLPKLAQQGLKTAVGTLIGSLTNRNERVVFFLKFLAPKNDPNVGFLEAQIDKINPPASFDEAAFLTDAETQFKQNAVSFAKSQVDTYIDQKPWPKFFKWVANIFVKLVVSLVMNISLKHRIWQFISDPKNDLIIKKMIWKFLETAEAYSGENVQSMTLSQTMQNAFKDHGLIPTIFLRKIIAGGLAEYLAGTSKVPGKNIVDILA